jgi:hypothetical protein
MVSGMKSRNSILTVLTLIALTACSTQEVKQDVTRSSTGKNSPTPSPDGFQPTGQNPPLILEKDDKKLNLVRVMDGGACKNDLQGVKGTFLLYANPGDIERIKSNKGTKIFSDFESKIQALATAALEQAINDSNLDEDPFALGEEEAQQKLAKQLTENFLNAVAGPTKDFEKETTLAIAITIFSPSLIIFQKGCEAIQTDESPETAN